MAQNNRYKQYLVNPSIPVPKTTAWRYKKDLQAIFEKEDSFSGITGTGNLGKRRHYNIRSDAKVPRQTAWSWKKQYGNMIIYMNVKFIVLLVQSELVNDNEADDDDDSDSFDLDSDTESESLETSVESGESLHSTELLSEDDISTINVPNVHEGTGE